MKQKKPITYRDAGVDIDAGNALVDAIKPLVKATPAPERLAGLVALSVYSTSRRQVLLIQSWSPPTMAWAQNSRSP